MQEYVVQRGDTLFAIAQRFGTTVQAILDANPAITNPDLIQVGQVIIIPVPPTTTPAPTVSCPVLRFGSRGSAVVRLQTALRSAGFNPGPIDGVFGLRTQTAVINFQRSRGLAVTGIVNVATWEALGFNCGPRPTPTPTPRPTPTPTPTIRPTIPPTQPPGFDYIVQPGDTMFAIAARFGVSLQALIAANPQISNPNFIVPGQRIRIPT